MSAKVVVKSKMRSADQIIEVLKRMGVPEGKIVNAPDGQKINGYRGRGWGTAEVLVLKSWHGGYSDIGFIRGDDGTFSVVIDHIDTLTASRGLTAQSPRGTSFTQLVEQWYAAETAVNTLKDHGYRATIRQDGVNLKVLAQQY